MAQPILTMLVITPNLAAWEADVNTNFATLEAAFEDNPLIVHVVATKAALPTEATNESTLCLVKGDGINDGLYHSDGTTWRLMFQLDFRGDGQALTSHDAQVVASHQRRSKVATDQAEIELALQDSADALAPYGSIAAEIVVNTAGAEEGDVVLHGVLAGALVEVLRCHGLEKHGRFIGAQGIGSFTLTNANALTDKVNGDELWVSDGLKAGEAPAAGTGVRAYWDATGAAWFRHTDDTAVAV